MSWRAAPSNLLYQANADASFVYLHLTGVKASNADDIKDFLANFRNCKPVDPSIQCTNERLFKNVTHARLHACTHARMKPAGLCRLFVVVTLCCGAPASAHPETGITFPKDSDLRVLRALIHQINAPLDDALAKVTIDHMIDPTVDVQCILRDLDHWAKVIQARLPPHATQLRKLLLLAAHSTSPARGTMAIHV